PDDNPGGFWRDFSKMAKIMTKLDLNNALRIVIIGFWFVFLIFGSKFSSKIKATHENYLL
ncbi:MAG TPA: hypothetical protein VFI78_06935, partial [Salinimicrobium sp.]|nr:hypothetical protein [Salinimicrobium sp.]